jgi:hypothetical protein
MQKLVIVVFGSARHGKDTVANILANRLGGHRTSFAEPLKRMCEEIIGVPANLDGPEKETRQFGSVGWTARRWWQWFGTDFIRMKIDPDYWPKKMVQNVRAFLRPVVVVSDGRFRNERTVPSRELGEEARVFNVLVYRPGIPDGRAPTLAWRIVRFLVGLVGVRVQLLHPTESEVLEMRKEALAGAPLFDAVLLNDGDLGQLTVRTTRLAAEILTRSGGGA